MAEDNVFKEICLTLSVAEDDNDESPNNGLTIDKALQESTNGVSKDPYSYLIQSFKELTNLYKGNADTVDLEDVKRFFHARLEK